MRLIHRGAVRGVTAAGDPLLLSALVALAHEEVVASEAARPVRREQQHLGIVRERRLQIVRGPRMVTLPGLDRGVGSRCGPG
jgi:hypothetical protein